MQLNNTQISMYEEDGFLLIEQLFNKEEIIRLKQSVSKALQSSQFHLIMESDGKTVRSLHRPHQTKDIFMRLSHDPRLVVPAMQILNHPIYVHQLKINLKAANTGEWWQWHRDYAFWREKDGMPTPRALNIAVFLDPVTEFNGPITFIKHSHCKDMASIGDSSQVTVDSQDKQAWLNDFSTDLTYSLNPDGLRYMLENGEMIAPKGEAGSALFFHSNVAHASTNNISPHDRAIVFITYNRVDNYCEAPPVCRPNYIVNRDNTPIMPATDILLEWKENHYELWDTV